MEDSRKKEFLAKSVNSEFSDGEIYRVRKDLECKEIYVEIF
jgi:hypothetical protein